jgi:hypothetical protein
LPGEVEDEESVLVAESVLVEPALPLAPGVTSKRGEDEFWLDEPLDVPVLLSSGCAPGDVVSPGVADPTPGAAVLPEPALDDPLELEPDWPLAGPPDESLDDPRFKPLDWPVELLLVSDP